MIAVAQQNMEMAELLLDYGALTTLVDEVSRAGLQYFMSRRMVCGDPVM